MLPSQDNQKYKSMKQIKYFLQEKEFRVPPTKKFSGWIRHHRDHGSLRGEQFVPEPQAIVIGEEIDLFSILSVGKIFLAGAEVTLSPMIDPKKDRNGELSINNEKEPLI
jgi:hypothetical protein